MSLVLIAALFALALTLLWAAALWRRLEHARWALADLLADLERLNLPLPPRERGR